MAARWAPRAATLAGVGALVEIREAGRYPDGRYDLLAAATGRFAIDSVDLGARAVHGRRRHAARGRGRRRAARRATGRVRDPPVRPLSRADADPRRRDGRGARHPGRARRSSIGRRGRSRRDATTDARRRTRGRRSDRRGRRDRRPRAWPSPTTRPSCPTCCRASSRSSCRAASGSWRPHHGRAPRGAGHACSTARSCCWPAGCGCSPDARVADVRRS